MRGRRKAEGGRGKHDIIAVWRCRCRFVVRFRLPPRSPSAFPLPPSLRPNPPLLATSLQATHRRIELHGTGGQPCGNRFDQARQAVFQGDEHAVAGAAFPAGRGTVPHLVAHRADQAAVLALHLPETRQRGQHAEFLQVGRIDRADQRLDQPVERLAAQPAADEGGHALVGVAGPRRDKVFQCRAEFAPRAKDGRDRQRPEPRGGHHQKAVRKPAQAAPTHDERPPAGGIGLRPAGRPAQVAGRD